MILYINMADFGKVTRAISQYCKHCLGYSRQGLLSADVCEQFKLGILLRLNICGLLRTNTNKMQLYIKIHYPQNF
jgi:hypothetical protein